MKDYRTLKIWEKSHKLVLQIYQVTLHFPKSEQYGLTSQIRRAGVSVPANIAEGCGRWGDTEFNRFLQIAMGSLLELDYHLFLSKDLGYLDDLVYQQLADNINELKRMIGTLIHKMKNQT